MRLKTSLPSCTSTVDEDNDGPMQSLFPVNLDVPEHEADVAHPES